MPSELAVPARPLHDESALRRTGCSTPPSCGIASATATSCPPARRYGARPAGWSTTRRTLGGYEETALQDPFDYAAEDRLADWWRAAIADPPDLGYAELPGYGKSYAGPGTRDGHEPIDAASRPERHVDPARLEPPALPRRPGLPCPAAALALLRRGARASTSEPIPTRWQRRSAGGSNRWETGRRPSSSATGPRRPTATRASCGGPGPRPVQRGLRRDTCELDGAKAARVPYIWVDNDLSFARGHIQGFPKKSRRRSRSAKRSTVGRGGPRLEPGRPSPATSPASAASWPADRSPSPSRPTPGFVPRALRLPDLAHPAGARPGRR